VVGSKNSRPLNRKAMPPTTSDIPKTSIRNASEKEHFSFGGLDCKRGKNRVREIRAVILLPLLSFNRRCPLACIAADLKPIKLPGPRSSPWLFDPSWLSVRVAACAQKNKSAMNNGQQAEEAMRSVFVIFFLLGTAPAFAQGVVNNRDGNGNLVRDKGVSASAVRPHATVTNSVNQAPAKPAAAATKRN
jgi:hypothetical protein